MKGPESDKLFTKSNSDLKDYDRILRMDVAALRKAMNDGEFTSLKLVNLYGIRCRTLAVEFNLATEENFVEALEIAKECDK